MTEKPGISTFIITLNEEANLERCLRSVMPFSEEIIVVDSGSTDRTLEIARRHTDKVFVQEWLGYGRQKQLALSKTTRPWVFSIDADEEVSPALLREIESLDFDAAGYAVPRKVRYLGRWITHGGWYPGRVTRLFRRDRGRFTDRRIHETVEVDGRVEPLHGDLYHYSYRGIADHLDKMNRFTSLSADQAYTDGRRPSGLKLLLAPPFECFKVYVLRLGLLDGWQGLVIAVLHGTYAFLKQAKLFERDRLGRDSTAVRRDRAQEGGSESVGSGG